jgi:hypothetical protein
MLNDHLFHALAAMPRSIPPEPTSYSKNRPQKMKFSLLLSANNENYSLKRGTNGSQRIESMFLKLLKNT